MHELLKYLENDVQHFLNSHDFSTAMPPEYAEESAHRKFDEMVELVRELIFREKLPD